MKKYVKLLTVLISILCGSGLLIYLHKYNQLRTILYEVNEHPRDLVLSKIYIRSSNVSEDVLTPPQTDWTPLADHFAYGGTWRKADGKIEVRTILLGPSTPEDIECRIWFDYGSGVNSVEGSFSFVQLSGESSKIFRGSCEVDGSEEESSPYMLVLLHANTKKYPKGKTLIPVYKYGGPKGTLTACIAPDFIGFGKDNFLEFLAFHKLIGLSNLVIYDNIRHYGVINRLKLLQTTRQYFHNVLVLPWNFPINDYSVERRALEVDCALRTSNMSESALLLDLNHYLVPKTKWSSVTQSLSKAPNPTQLLVPTEYCCTNEPDDKHSEDSWPTILKKTRCMKNDFKTAKVLIHGQSLEEQRAIEKSVDSTEAVLKIFVDCAALPAKPKYSDVSPLQFKKALFSDTFYKLFTKGYFYAVNN